MRKKILALALTLALVVSLCPATLAATFIWPLDSTHTTITSLFGERDRPIAGATTNHKAVDIGAKYGDSVCAVASGTISKTNTSCTHNGPGSCGCGGGLGNYVHIDHGNGYITIYGHLTSVSVSVGQKVDQGTLIGTAGSTGNSTGSHLHLAMELNGQRVDPLNYVDIPGTSSTTPSTTANGPSTLKISPATEPGENMPQGQPFYFKGKITSNYVIHSATISINSADGLTNYQSKTVTPNTTSVDIATSGLDALKFGQLAPGNYLFHLVANDKSGRVENYMKKFSIAGATSAPTTPAPATPAPAAQSKPTITEAGVGSDDVNLMENIYPYIQYNSSSPATVTMTATVNASPLAASEITVTENSSNYYSCKFPARVEGTYTVQFTVKNAGGSVSSPVYKIHSSLKSQPQQPEPPQSQPPAAQTSEMYNIAIQYFLDGARFSTYNIPIKHGDSTAFDLRLERSDIPALVALESGTWDEAYTLTFVDVHSNITANLYYETPEEETPVPTSTPSSKPEPTSKPTATAQPTPKPSAAPSTTPEPSATPTPTLTGNQSNFRSVNTYHSGTFYDVSVADWFNENVKRAYELGLMKGMSENSFGPNSSVTVAQAVTLAARLHSIYYTGSENFVQSGSNWYDVYVNYAQLNGILNGLDLDYTVPISRQTFSRILAASMPKEALPDISNGNIQFGDNDMLDSRMASSVYQLAEAGIIRGIPNLYGGMDFAPNDSITRAQVAAIVTRMADPSLRQ